MDGAAIMEQARLMLALGAAQRAAIAAHASGGAGLLAAQLALCAAIEHTLAFGVRHDPTGVRGSVEMAVNEFGTLGDLLENAGEPGADAAFERATRHARDYGATDLIARGLVNFAAHCQVRGEFAQALAMLYEARDLAESTPGAPEAQVDAIVSVGRRFAEVWRWLGDFRASATELARSSARVAKLLKAADAIQSVVLRMRLNDLMLEEALAHIDKGGIRLDDAERLLDAIEPIYLTLGIAPAAAMRYYRAKIAAGRGNTAVALAIIDAALPTFSSEPALRSKVGTIRTLRARILNDAGDGAEALADAEAGAADAIAMGARETLWNAHWQLARARGAVNNVQGALCAFDDAVAAVDAVRVRSLGYRLDNLFLRERRPMFDAAMRLAAVKGDAVRAARYADAVKSRFLARALEEGPGETPGADWVARLDTLGIAIDAIDRDPLVRAGSDELTRLRAERAAMIERQRIERSSAENSAPILLNVEAVLADLATRDQAALQLFVVDDAVIATLLYGGEARVATLKLDAQMRDAIAAYSANLAQEPGYQSSPHHDPAHLGLAFNRLIPAVLVERALGARSLLVAAHDATNLLPWAMLPLGEQRLCEVLPVGLTPNLAAIVPLAARPVARARAALLGAPDESDLPAAQRLVWPRNEINTLAELYGGANALMDAPATGVVATLDRLRALFSHPDAGDAILHLACHGIFVADDPAGAGLRLTGRTLSAAEIAVRPLRFGEVTLAACSTALRPTEVDGVRLLGDDVVGLPASFLESGVGALLVSTTPAGDAASAAMLVGYHSRRLVGETPLLAFAATQRAMLAEGAHRPRDWAGFCIYACR